MITKKGVALTILLQGILYGAFAQLESVVSTGAYAFNEWTKQELTAANTAVAVAGLNKEEKQVIYLCNLARINGPLFAKTYLKQYVAEHKMDKSYVKSLQKTLKAQSVLKPFQYSEELFEVAKSHAKKSGSTGNVGHKNFQKRYKAALNTYNSVAENCDYGNKRALDIVMSLLIDEGVPNLGHRINILAPNLSHVGVSIQKHKTYGTNCVMSFGAL